MSYLVLARKYRPRNFSEMVGQSHVVQALGNALTTQRLHHAYLFTGTRGVGKTTISRILAKSLNCLGPDGQGGITATPCGVCQACTDIDSGRFVDYTELDAASNRGVDEIAQLLEQAVYKPVVGRFKVFMIDEVHMLTNTAFNAMLKTLEEPPEYLKFVLATTDPQKVPATVLSRCLQFNLRPMAPETILDHLGQVLQTENVASEPQALRLLARAARGSMRDALSLTDQAIAFGSGQLQEASVRLMLGSVDRSYVFQLLDALARGDGKSVVETSEVLRLNGLSAASTLEEMATVLQRMAVLQAVPGIGEGDDEVDPDIAATARLAQAMPADETQLLYSLCLHGRAELGLAPDDYAALTMVLLRLLAFKPAGAVATTLGSAVEPPKKPQPERAPAALVATPAIRPAAVPVPVPTPAAAPATRSNFESNRPPAHIQRAPAAPDLVAPGALQRPPWEDELLATPAPAAGPVPAPEPVQATAASATPAAPVAVMPPLDSPLGDEWTTLVNRMVAAEMVAALARELALQSELRSQADGVWTLRVESESLNQVAARDKLQLALLSAFQDTGQALQLVVELGPVSDSPARRNAAAALERQRQAEETIQNDPFVQDMIRDWGAKIVPGSVKPRSPAAGKPI
ncbi:MAG: DNA polymerase III subunit gamma/tau [Polaromonas sp.]|uniref:DNA polymerase III subunit gamma/tau n=1 Tax=Polaromonas sp. TaxID=1869339 RepID=UPI00273711C6|nr:DNA polymerase III subunit gamma/tau [Polaromonas sp.]MDP2818624.1 DNA polymerase III subunit gamma/tau [Polaromonas sp.]